jgi:predicted permease
MSWISGARTRLQLLFGRRAAESRIDEEVRFHLDMETTRLMRDEHLSPQEARRRARATFGGATQHTETLREGRGLAWLSGFSLDMKVGGRMLLKYPGITLVGGLAMAFAIWFGAVTFQMLGIFVFPTLTLPGGDRIVKVYNWDTKANQLEKRSVQDFLVWRDQMKTIVDFGAYRDVPRNLVVPDHETREVNVAEMTASGFALSSARPLFGRTFTSADERDDAVPVVVIGYKVWRDRLDADPAILGKSIKLGNSFATVIGVMPEGYGFPRSHEVWMPLRVAQLDRTPRGGSPINIFARLADGASIQEAQSELDLIGRRMAAQFPSTHEFLKPLVRSYVDGYDPSGAIDVAAAAINVMVVALLAMICGNVALLIFARAATRETELTVRSALGASRGRLVVQLFAEALVLGLVAATLGLAAAAFTLRIYGRPYLEMNVGTLPFWADVNLSPLTVLYALGLTVIGAVVAGALPALRVTRGISAKLRQGTSGSGLRFSGVWTFVIVAEVAATVVLPAIVAFEQNEIARVRTNDVGFPSKEYLSLLVAGDSGMDVRTLEQRIATEPGVRSVTFTSSLPGASPDGYRIFIADSAQLPPGERVVGVANVSLNYFDALNTRVLSGRPFHSGDLTGAARSVIVDLRFVETVLHGRNPIGRRMRIGRTDSSWWEIVGVVKNLGLASPIERHVAPGVYKAAEPGADAPYMMVHMAGDPIAIAPRLREIAEAVDPSLRLNEITRLDLLSDSMVWFLSLWQNITVILTAVAVLLSLAGIYAVLSFIVSRRTREIGVRVAVGASPRLIVGAIFRRPIVQVSSGILIGAMVVGLGSVVVRNYKPDTDLTMDTLAGGMSAGQLATLIGYAALMLAVCLLACIVPTRRALSVQPTEALRAE